MPIRLFLSRVGSALYATVVTTLGLLAGLWGSLYSSEIRSAWPFQSSPYEGVSAHALFFWSLVLSATFLFFRRQVLVEKARRHAERELTNRVDKLEELIRTQPPEDFLSLCAQLYKICFATHDALKYSQGQKLEPEKIAQSTRLVLRTFVILAQQFDRAPNLRYAANVMLFRDAKQLTSAAQAEMKQRLRFCDHEVGIENLRGVLDLRCDLSTVSLSSNADPDPDLRPLALPVPQQDHPDKVFPGEAEYRSRLLPGGPRAFYKGTMECYLDTSTLPIWCQQHGDFSPGIQQDLDDYFRNHEMGIHVKSFVSIPLRNPQAENEILGVLNLHRNEVGMLKAEQLARQFLQVVTPNILTLERLLASLRTIEDKV
jgi:hypothetical protein